MGLSQLRSYFMLHSKTEEKSFPKIVVYTFAKKLPNYISHCTVRLAHSSLPMNSWALDTNNLNLHLDPQKLEIHAVQNFMPQ